VNAKRIFISCAPGDAHFVSKLKTGLESGICNISVQNAEDRGISDGDIFLAVLSPEYLRFQQGGKELDSAGRSALIGRGRLIPVVRGACKVGGFVGMLEPADFSSDDNFDVALSNLIRAINTTKQHADEPGRVRSSITMPEFARVINGVSSSILDLQQTGSPAPDRFLQPSTFFQKVNIVAVNVGVQMRSILAAVIRPASDASAKTSIFISYVQGDHPFAVKLISRIRKELPGVAFNNAFLVQPRRFFSESLLPEMRPQDVFLPVLSGDYLGSPSAQQELVRASLLVLRGRGRILPLLRSQCRPPGLVAMLEPVDFTNDGAFEEACQALVHAIAGQHSEPQTPGQIRGDLTIQQYAKAALENTGSLAPSEREEKMQASAPERIRVKNARLGEFQRELHSLMEQAAAGEFDDELRERGIDLPRGISSDTITAESVSEQPVAAELFVVLAIKYAPLMVPIGTDLWRWAWPKLRDYFDGAAREDDSE
jgi:TIR domain